jgi:hypothetical protein
VEDGGPIGSRAALALADSGNPFKLSIGQWAFIHDFWKEDLGASTPSSSGAFGANTESTASKPLPMVETVHEEPEVHEGAQEPISSVAKTALKATLKGPAFNTADTPSWLKTTSSGDAARTVPSLMNFFAKVGSDDIDDDKGQAMMVEFLAKMDSHLENQAKEVKALKSRKAELARQMMQLYNRGRGGGC